VGERHPGARCHEGFRPPPTMFNWIERKREVRPAHFPRFREPPKRVKCWGSSDPRQHCSSLVVSRMASSVAPGVAGMAEGDEVFLDVMSLLAPEPLMVHFEVRHRPANLATPAVALEHAKAKLPVSPIIQTQSCRSC
jgi:hypothetical protein